MTFLDSKIIISKATKIIIYSLVLLFLISCTNLSDKISNSKDFFIPFKLVKGVIIVQGTINSIDTFNLLFDTGSETTRFSEDIIDKYCHYTNDSTWGVTTTTIAKFRNYICPKINFNRFLTDSLVVTSEDLKKENNYFGFPISGTLGMDAFKKNNFFIDFKKHQIIIKPSTFDTILNCSFNFNQSKPVVNLEMKIGNKKISGDFLLDTGCDIPLIIVSEYKDSISIDNLKLEMNTIINKSKKDEEPSFLQNLPFKKYSFVPDFIKINNNIFETPTVKLLDTPFFTYCDNISGCLGMPILSKYLIFVNNKRQNICIEYKN